MHRIDTATAQQDKFGVGKNGYTNGDSSTGRRATQLDADVFDAYQEEICSVIEAAGISLDKGSHAQLLAALKALFLMANDTRVSGALQKSKNLGDLNSVAQAKQNLELDKVGNWKAVQANGGLHSTGNHYIYIDWAMDGKLHITVDETDVGEVFTTANPPTASQVQALSLSGGILNEEASITVITGDQTGSAGQALYGPLFRSCMKNRGGDRDFKDGGSACFRVVEVVNNYAYAEILVDGWGVVHSFHFRSDGTIKAPSSVYAGDAFIAPDGNVYGAVWGGYLSNYIAGQIGAVNNNMNARVNDIARGNQQYQPGSGTGQGMTWECSVGCFLTGINTNVSDGRGMGVYFRGVHKHTPNTGWVQIGDDGL